MRNYEKEYIQRVQFIRSAVRESGADGIVYGNSGGKDSALVGILCKAACDNTVGIIMPCTSVRNYDMDKRDGETVCRAVRHRNALRRSHRRQGGRKGRSGRRRYQAHRRCRGKYRSAPENGDAVCRGGIGKTVWFSGTGNRSEGYVGYFYKMGRRRVRF